MYQVYKVDSEEDTRRQCLASTRAHVPTYVGTHIHTSVCTFGDMVLLCNYLVFWPVFNVSLT